LIRYGKKTTDLFYEIQEIAVHQGNEPEPAGYRVRKMLVELYAGRVNFSYGKTFRSLPGKQGMI